VQDISDEFLQELIDWKAPFDVPTKNKETPLQTCCILKRAALAEDLIRNGADVNKKGTEIPLLPALRTPSILKLLVEGGADLKQHPSIHTTSCSKLEVPRSCFNTFGRWS